MLGFANVYRNVAALGIGADYHSLIHHSACSDKQIAAFLSVVQSVHNRFAGFKSDKRTGSSSGNFAAIFVVFIEYRTHNAFASRIGEKFGFIAEQSARRNRKFQFHAVSGRRHGFKFAGAHAHFGYNRAHAVFRDVGNHNVDRFAQNAVYFFIQNARLRNLEFVAFSSHVFDENGQVHFASAAHLERFACFAVVYSYAYVANRFLIKARAKVT